jgi:hypothetical protein
MTAGESFGFGTVTTDPHCGQRAWCPAADAATRNIRPQRPHAKSSDAAVEEPAAGGKSFITFDSSPTAANDLLPIPKPNSVGGESFRRLDCQAIPSAKGFASYSRGAGSNYNDDASIPVHTPREYRPPPRRVRCERGLRTPRHSMVGYRRWACRPRAAPLTTSRAAARLPAA